MAKAYRVYREDCNLDEVYDSQDPPKREVNYWGSVEKAHKSGLLSLQPRENETTTPLQSSVTTTKDSITVFMWRRLRMVECTHRLGVIRKRLVEHGLRSRPVGLPPNVISVPNICTSTGFHGRWPCIDPWGCLPQSLWKPPPEWRFYLTSTGFVHLRTTLNQPPYAHPLMTTDRTTIQLTDERKRLLEQASEIVASDQSDDPPMSDVIDAALTHLVES